MARVTAHEASAAAAAGLGVLPVDAAALELPPRQGQRARVFPCVPREVAVVLVLAGELGEVPAHAPPRPREAGHPRSPADASARFSAAVAMRPEGATMFDGTAGT